LESARAQAPLNYQQSVLETHVQSLLVALQLKRQLAVEATLDQSRLALFLALWQSLSQHYLHTMRTEFALVKQ
jgi:hypothetical protein